MTVAEVGWPQKTREFQNHHMDSTRWNEFEYRDNDIVIATWAKAGTTWTQQIISQLIFDGAEGLPVMDISPWLEARFIPLEELMQGLAAQRHRRFIKTHLPIDALVFSPEAKYIYLARDGRDTVWSLYNHHCSASDEFYEMINGTPGRVGPALPRPKADIVEYFRDWLSGNGYPWWEFWSHTQGWWDARDLPNVMLVHFNDLKSDMAGQIRRMAEFLEIEINEERWPAIVEHCTFDYMKRSADVLSPILEVAFRGGGKSFVNKGTNGRWRDVLGAEDIAGYESAARQNLSPECAHWLATGERLEA
jgi:aryl sulfotransferase